MAFPAKLQREPQPGDVYEFVQAQVTITGVPLPEGTTLTLIEWTAEAPFGFRDPAGNWVVDGPNGRTVWSSIRQGIANGSLKLIMQLKSCHSTRTRWTRINEDL